MNATEKYLFETRMAFLTDDEPLSDADLDAMLGTDGPGADSVKRVPNPLSAAGLVDMLGAVIERSDRRLEAAAEVFGLDLLRLLQAATEAEQDGDVDRATANTIALTRELARRGRTVEPLTKWILTNAEHLRNVMVERGRSREQMRAEVVGYFEGENTAGRSNPDYADAIRHYFDPEREAMDTECKLLSCCVLLGWNYEAMAEKAAMLELDAGMSRTAAAMRAVWYALRNRQPRISEATALLLFDLADAVLDGEQEHGWPRTQTIEWLLARMHGASSTVFIPHPVEKVAV